MGGQGVVGHIPGAWKGREKKKGYRQGGKGLRVGLGDDIKEIIETWWVFWCS